MKPSMYFQREMVICKILYQKSLLELEQPQKNKTPKLSDLEHTF